MTQKNILCFEPSAVLLFFVFDQTIVLNSIENDAVIEGAAFWLQKSPDAADEGKGDRYEAQKQGEDLQAAQRYEVFQKSHKFDDSRLHEHRAQSIAVDKITTISRVRILRPRSSFPIESCSPWLADFEEKDDTSTRCNVQSSVSKTAIFIVATVRVAGFNKSHTAATTTRGPDTYP